MMAVSVALQAKKSLVSFVRQFLATKGTTFALVFYHSLSRAKGKRHGPQPNCPTERQTATTAQPVSFNSSALRQGTERSH
jgi:hypothetical protein